MCSSGIRIQEDSVAGTAWLILVIEELLNLLNGNTATPKVTHEINTKAGRQEVKEISFYLVGGRPLLNIKAPRGGGSAILAILGCSLSKVRILWTFDNFVF